MRYLNIVSRVYYIEQSNQTLSKLAIAALYSNNYLAV